jgi:demethylmenaquinone methyltransferase/2-methoxy-6-polyprenyl-1,4-benzoquinol methylase
LNTNRETVPRDPARVREMFGKISRPYDCINRLCSLGIDRYWRRQLIVSVGRCRTGPVLDLATGSGDVALLLQRAGYDVTGLDFCAPMLALARQKGVKKLLQGDAMHMPFPDQSFAAVTVAFGFRNFADYTLALREIWRVLQPGSALHILEFSSPAKWLAGPYRCYLGKIMPLLAGIISRQPGAYDYLASTVARFPDADGLAALLAAAGYTNIAWQKHTFGIVAIHRGQKPVSGCCQTHKTAS